MFELATTCGAHSMLTACSLHSLPAGAVWQEPGRGSGWPCAAGGCAATPRCATARLFAVVLFMRRLLMKWVGIMREWFCQGMVHQGMVLRRLACAFTYPSTLRPAAPPACRRLHLRCPLHPPWHRRQRPRQQGTDTGADRAVTGSDGPSSGGPGVPVHAPGRLCEGDVQVPGPAAGEQWQC